MLASASCVSSSQAGVWGKSVYGATPRHSQRWWQAEQIRPRCLSPARLSGAPVASVGQISTCPGEGALDQGPDKLRKGSKTTRRHPVSPRSDAFSCPAGCVPPVFASSWGDAKLWLELTPVVTQAGRRACRSWKGLWGLSAQALSSSGTGHRTEDCLRQGLVGELPRSWNADTPFPAPGTPRPPGPVVFPPCAFVPQLPAAASRAYPRCVLSCRVPSCHQAAFSAPGAQRPVVSTHVSL